MVKVCPICDIAGCHHVRERDNAMTDIDITHPDLDEPDADTRDATPEVETTIDEIMRLRTALTASLAREAAAFEAAAQECDVFIAYLKAGESSSNDNLGRAIRALTPAGAVALPVLRGGASDSGYQKFGRPLRDTSWADGSEITEAYFCNCPSCGFANIVGIVGHQTKADAVASWNRRAPTSPDLLAVAESVIAWADAKMIAETASGMVCILPKFVDAARAAIAKAKGVSL